MRNFFNNRNPSKRILMIYITISGLWILGSDWVLDKFITDNMFVGSSLLSMIKGMFFVIVTGGLLYKLIDRNFRFIQDSEERYRRLVENSPEIILVHIDGEIIFINNAGVKFVGGDNPNGIIGKHILDFIPNYSISLVNNIQQSDENVFEEQTILHPNGKYVPVETISFQTIYRGKNAIQVIIRDVTERKKAEDRINYLAYYDSVTNLPNRNFLNEYLNKVISYAKHKKDSFAVMLLDLDRFKMINDTFGHDAGDLLLKQVSNRLKKCIPKDNFVSRYGGDEFIIILKYVKHQEVSDVAERIIHELSFPIELITHEVFITPSIGISIFPKDGNTKDSLIKHADLAMYLAKERGRNAFCFYDTKLNEKNKRKMQIEIGLRKAIENNELDLYYQPQINLSTGKLVGMEALVRWNNKDLGNVSPYEFIPIAEETGMIISIGEWILNKACSQLRDWKRKGLSDVQVAVNISVKQFHDKGFLGMIFRILSETGIDPKYLQLEITESIVQNIEESILILNSLKVLGIKIAIDDFGTGYSSLSVLKHLHVDNLKIDKSFIHDINTDGDAIVKTIIQMGHNLNFTLIAEGVEYKDQVEFLRDQNCHVAQGFYFSKPLSSKEMGEVLYENKEIY